MRLRQLPELGKGIHDNCIVSSVDTKERKGRNGIINKMIYLAITKLNNDGKPVAEVEVSWWKPDPTSEYFYTNLLEVAYQTTNLLKAYMPEDEVYKQFDGIFEAFDCKTVKDIEEKKWKQSEVKQLLESISTAFKEAIEPYIGDKEKLIRVKLTTDHKGQGVEIPKYGPWIEPMTQEETKLYFTANEEKAHSKAGITSAPRTSKVTAAGTASI